MFDSITICNSKPTFIAQHCMQVNTVDGNTFLKSMGCQQDLKNHLCVAHNSIATNTNFGTCVFKLSKKCMLILIFSCKRVAF